ncbi:MAG TPA: hypothetical protein VIQ81_09755 [Gammaproteobacteria bacterium]
MEIALTGFNPSFTPLASDASRQGNRNPADRSGEQRARDLQNQQTPPRRVERSNQTASANEGRVIDGEVLSSATYRPDRQGGISFLTPSADRQQTPNGQPDPRRLSMNQAIQNFQQNEDMVSQPNSVRQVSGIIDLYV